MYPFENYFQSTGLYSGTPSYLILLIVVLSIWDAAWKIIVMRQSGRNNHLIWFATLFIFSTLGILPIIYLLINKKNEKNNFRQLIQCH